MTTTRTSLAPLATLAVIAATLLATGSARADWRWDKQRQHDAFVEEKTTAPSYCFDGGWDIGGFVSGIWPENVSNNGLGGGVALSYFFNRNLGFELSYAAHGNGVSQQVGMGTLVYRVPIETDRAVAFAPYVFGGPGVLSDGGSEFLWEIGGGVDVRFASWGCTSLFADYTYGFADDNLSDFSMVRLGFKLPF